VNRLARALIAAVGLGVAAYLVAAHGFDQVFRALHLAGWRGLVAVTGLHVVPTVLCGVAWWLLLRTHSDVSWPTYVWVRWLRDGLDSIVPVLPVSGELIGIRMLALRGVEYADAGTVIDLTAELLTQTVFATVGLALLHFGHPHARDQLWIALGILAMAVQYLGFMLAQQKGLFRLIQHPFDWLRRHKPGGADAPAYRTLHERILIIYRARGAFAACLLLHLVAWFVSGLESWLGLWFMHQSRSVADVLVLESLVYAIRSIAFFIPLGAGVQEGGYVLIGSLLGIPAPLALAVALLRRGRDLCIGVPALLFWQGIEVRVMGRGKAVTTEKPSAESLPGP
jgi:putative membrane protein